MEDFFGEPTRIFSITAIMSQSSGLSMAGKGFFGSLCAGTFGLGVWQTQRYFEKTELVAQREQALGQPPQLTLPNFAKEEDAFTNGGSSSSTFRRIQLNGRYIYNKECLVGPRGPPPGALPNKPGYSAGGMSRAPQGYFVVTPFQVVVSENAKNQQSTSRSSSHKTLGKEGPIVWINRGWIPRYLIYNDKQQPLIQEQQQPQQTSSPRPPGRGGSTAVRLVPTWDRQSGLVSVTCVSSEAEEPRFLVADHKLDLDPPELFWMDLATIRGYYYDDDNNKIKNKNNKKNNDSDSSSLANHQQAGKGPMTSPLPAVHLLTAVQDNNDEDKEEKHINNYFPLSPPAQNVGEFKTSPMIHAGYAATWYGLAAAGLYMTRILILRR